MNQSQSTKWMTHGEAGLAAFFLASSFICLIATAKALETCQRFVMRFTANAAQSSDSAKELAAEI